MKGKRKAVLKRPEKVVIFCAHSDDQVLGAGGTIAKYAKEGKEVYTFVFSFGELSHPWLKGEVTTEMRINEAEEADKLLGGKGAVFFGLKEGKFMEEYQRKGVRDAIISIVRKAKPEKVFTHSRDDPHPDHRATHDIVMAVLDEMAYRGQVYAFNVWGPLRLHKRSAPQLYVDITDTFGTKMKALELFRSQWQARLLLTWSMYAKAWMAGTHNECRYAESFVKER